MFYTPPSRFAPPTYPRKKLPIAASPPEQAQSQPQQPVKVPYRPLAQAYSSQTTDATPLIFRALAHPSQRRPLAAAAASSSTFPAPQSQTQPASPPAPPQPPAQPPQTPLTASPATQSTEVEAVAHVESEPSLRDQPPIAGPSPQPSSKPTAPTPQSPSQPPSTPAPSQPPAQSPQTPSTTASPVPQSTEEEAPKVTAAPKEVAEPQAPTTPAPASPQSPSQPPTPPAPSQPPAPPPQSSEETDPKAVDAVNKAAAQTAADTARREREAQLAELEANGMAEHAKALRALDAEMAQRRADLEKKHPQHGAQYEASLRELEKEKAARQAPVMEKIQAFKKRERVDNLRAAKIVVSRESKLPQTRGKTEEQKQAEWKAQMARAGLDPNNHEHVSAYWDAKRLHYLNDGHHAKYDWDGSTPKREGFGSAVLSDGSLHVAPEFIHNDKKYAAVVAASGASEAEKARAMADLPRLQQAYAQAMLPILKQAGSTRAAQWIPGIASFQKWQAEKPRQGSEAEQANEYLKEMNQRGLWSKATDNVLRNLLVGFSNMGTMAAGLAGMAGVPGASETAAEWSKRGSDFLAPISAEGGNSGTASAVFGHVAGMIGPMAASLLLTRGLGGGLATMSTISGAQTAGLQYAETYGQLREEGKTHAQAWMATAPFALASGLATAFLTAAGGHTGFEAALTTRADTQTAKDAAQGFWKNLLLNVPKHALADIPQELPDELFSQMMSALATNHHADLGQVVGDFIQNSPQLIAAIALMGGAGGAMKAHQESSSGAEQTQVDASQKTDGTRNSSASDQSSSTTTAGRPSTPPLSVEQSQKLIHNVMNRPVEQRGHPTTQADFAQAQWVVREQVRKLESQKEPLSEAQKKALADAKAALARMPPTAVAQQKDSELPGNDEKPAEDKKPPTEATTKHLTGTTKDSVDHKVYNYLLNPAHKDGGPKSKWLNKALGFTRENGSELAQQLIFDPSKAVPTIASEHGQKFSQIIPLRGANGKTIPTEIVWIKNHDGVIRIITLIPADK